MTRSALPSLGISLAGSIPPQQLVPAYQLIERSGFAEIWVHEDYFYHGGCAAAAMALQATQRVKVGIGVISAVVRHPAVTAMEIATLAGAYPGRLKVGIGHGAPFSTKQLGLYPKSPMRSLREVLTSVRRLLAGETLTQTETFIFDNVKLAHPVAGVPLYTGVIGPKSLALSGEIADGTVVTVMSGPRYIAHAREIIAQAAKAAGRSSAHDLPVLSLCFVGRDAAAARRTARRTVAEMLALAGPDILTGVYGIDAELTDMIARGGVDTLVAEMPDQWIDWFAAAGDPERCLERIHELHRAGATSVILTLTDPATVHSSIDLLGQVLARN